MSELTPAREGYPIKVVRDRTAQIVNPSSHPGDLFYGPPPQDGAKTGSVYRDIIRLLRLKLAEEVGEYLVDGSLDELADVLAVVEALATHQGSSLEELISKMESDPRGGFTLAVTMYGYHPEFDGKESE